MKINLPSWIKGKNRQVDINSSKVKKTPNTAPLDEGLFHYHKDKKIQNYSDARTITRVLKESESGQKSDLSLAFEEALLKIFQKYPNPDKLTGFEKMLVVEKVTGALKYFIEILVIRNHEISDALKEQINYYLNFYNIPYSKKLQINNLINVLTRNKEELELFDDYLKGDPGNIFFQIFGDKLSNYPTLKITKGPIGYEFRGSLEDINKVYKISNPSKRVGGFATERNFRIGNKLVNIYINFFPEGSPNVYNHELQHNINRMFIYFINEGYIADQLFILKKISKNPHLEKKILEESYEATRKDLMSSFANELLAQIEGGASIEKINEYMKPSLSGKQYYNYFENFDSSNPESVRGITEYYYYSKSDDKIYPSVNIIPNEDLKRAGLTKINIDSKLNLQLRAELKIKFENDIKRILRALEIIMKKNEVDMKNVKQILSINPTNRWEKLLKDLAIPEKRSRILEDLRRYLSRA